MTRSKDRKYYQKRAREEAELASKSEDGAVRNIHRRMAEEYRRLADSDS